jgi:hypothetical protein
MPCSRPRSGRPAARRGRHDRRRDVAPGLECYRAATGEGAGGEVAIGRCARCSISRKQLTEVIVSRFQNDSKMSQMLPRAANSVVCICLRANQASRRGEKIMRNLPKVAKAFGRLGKADRLRQRTVSAIKGALVAAGLLPSAANVAATPSGRGSQCRCERHSLWCHRVDAGTGDGITDGRMLQAQHVSHSSHVSHASHASHCSGYSYCG